MPDNILLSRGGDSDLASHWCTTSAVAHNYRTAYTDPNTELIPQRPSTAHSTASRSSLAVARVAAEPDDSDRFVSSYMGTFQRPQSAHVRGRVSLGTGHSSSRGGGGRDDGDSESAGAQAASAWAANVVVESSGFTKNNPNTFGSRLNSARGSRRGGGGGTGEEDDGHYIHPSVLRRMKVADPIGAENGGRGPGYMSTTSRTAHNGRTSVFDGAGGGPGGGGGPGDGGPVVVGHRSLSGHAINVVPHFPPPPSPPEEEIASSVPAALRHKARSTRKLEYEGHVRGSIYNSSFKDPTNHKTGFESLPPVSRVEGSNFGRSTTVRPPYEELSRDPRAIQTDPRTLAPAVLERIRTRDPVAMRDLEAPSVYATTNQLNHRYYHGYERMGPPPPARAFRASPDEFASTDAAAAQLRDKGLTAGVPGRPDLSLGPPPANRGRNFGSSAAPFDRGSGWEVDLTDTTSAEVGRESAARGKWNGSDGFAIPSNVKVEASGFVKSTGITTKPSAVLNADAVVEESLVRETWSRSGTRTVGGGVSMKERIDARNAVALDRTHSHKQRWSRA